jgi:hypothetical protein
MLIQCSFMASAELPFAPGLCRYSFLDRVCRVCTRCRTLPLPDPSQRCDTKRDNVDDKNRNQHPPPSNHVRHLGVNLVALVLVRKGKIQHGLEPCLWRPFKLGIVPPFVVGSDGQADGLTRGLICHNEDEDECAESEQNSQELENQEGSDGLERSLLPSQNGDE